MTWPEITVKDVSLRITKGTTPTTLGEAFTDQGVRFIKAEALNGDSNLDANGFAFIDEKTHELLRRSILQSEDVLITIAGAKTGKCGFVREEHLPANTNQAVAIVRIDKQKAVPRFVYYLFKRKEMFSFIQSLSAQAAQPNLNLTRLGQIHISLPPSNQQRQITSILSAYDDLIENNRRRMQLLEQAARLLYKEWFVRFRFPGHEHVKIKDAVPEGWQKKKIEDICQTIGGGTPSTSNPAYWDSGDVTWVIPSDVTRNDCLPLIDSEKKITESGIKSSSARMVPPETILMTSRASVGFFALMDKEVCTNQGFINIVPHEAWLRMYLLHNLMYQVEEIRLHAGGATYKEISKGRFRQMAIIVPSKLLSQEFDDIAFRIFQQVRVLKKQQLNLMEARDLLLPRLMNGEIAV
ncbi:MAG: restriction endonuclease subunit S [Deltaproteobacteria bacterium]|nr:MAG: restriction endonuclease subunit S [Deltaproteobacteria bacterium]